MPEILLARLGAAQAVQQLRELHHASGCEHESRPGTAQGVDELVILDRGDVVHLGVGARDEHLLALLDERCEDMRSNRHRERCRAGARQVMGRVRDNIIQDEGAGYAVHCTDAELLQI